MSHRLQQAESLLQRTVAQVLQRQVSDPRIAGLVGVTKVKVTPDFKRADVYVSVMPEKYEKRTLAGLRHATMHIQGKVKKLVALRTVPHLQFELDRSIKNQAAVEAAIRGGLDRTGPPEADAPEADPPEADAADAAAEAAPDSPPADPRS
ncbi:MAG: 30S ribosome-binding factor RbfA [Planctomycetes bacterium]|jgi:ribosome-binding factor A|nr:30S ribosome-binding factor RbfA [Planctomycetota bacterium]